MSYSYNFPDYLTDTQSAILVALNVNSAEPIYGKITFQKIMFLISKNIDILERKFNFENYLMGPHSEIADEDLIQLKIEGFVAKRKYPESLTPSGKEIATNLQMKLTDSQLSMISDMKKLINKLEMLEILGIIYITFPETITDSEYYDDVIKYRQKIAYNLYNKDKITFDKASEISGFSANDFMDYLLEKGNSIFGVSST